MNKLSADSEKWLDDNEFLYNNIGSKAVDRPIVAKKLAELETEISRMDETIATLRDAPGRREVPILLAEIKALEDNYHTAHKQFDSLLDILAERRDTRGALRMEIERLTDELKEAKRVTADE